MNRNEKLRALFEIRLKSYDPVDLIAYLREYTRKSIREVIFILHRNVVRKEEP